MITNNRVSTTHSRTNKLALTTGQRASITHVHKNISSSKTREPLPAVLLGGNRSSRYKESKYSTSKQALHFSEADDHSSDSTNDEGATSVESIKNNDNFYQHASLKKRIAESPLSGMYCAGQQFGVRGENNVQLLQEYSENSVVRQNNCLRNTEVQGTRPIALNKLYSSLKKLKSRHDPLTREDIEKDVRLRCVSFPFKHSKCFRPHECLDNGNPDDEEIFILLGGKSKPVRFEVNPDNLNLLENEFGLKLKSKSINTSLDQEDIELLKRFREKYRTGVPGNTSPFVPWARHHAIYNRPRKGNDTLMNSDATNRQTAILPSATYNVEEEEFGRKLSIHVYLPNRL